MSHAPAQRSAGWGRWLVLGLAAIWLVFLVDPVQAALGLPRPLPRAAALAALVVFALAYLAVFARRRPFGAFTADDDGRHDRPGAYATLGPMTVSMIVLVALVGDRAVGLAIFLSAASAVELTVRRSVLVALSMTGATAVVAFQKGSAGTDVLPIIVLVTWLTLWSSRRVVSDNAKLRRAEGELAAMRVLAERERVARDVHDLLGHTLTVLTIKAQVVDRLIDDDPAGAHAEMAEIEALTRSALADVRGTVTQLRVPDLAEQLAASGTALRAAGLGLVVEGDPAAVPQDRRPLWAWVLREATTNVIRHAEASTVRVRVRPGRLEVVDDGVGLPADVAGNGLVGLRERAAAAGAELVVRPAHAGAARPGTRLEVSFP